MKNYSPSPHDSIFPFFEWLEYHWATPAYGGWVLIGIALSFFGAATNTMAGWLYVLSGVLLSLLGLNLLVSINTLKNLQIRRSKIEPVTTGNDLTIELSITNLSKKNKTLIEIIDHLPPELSGNIHYQVETLSPQKSLKLTAYAHSRKRGIYHWHDITLKTAAPFGLFYSSRRHSINAKAIIYPQILPLQTCPLVDSLGNQETKQKQREKLSQNATEGITKALRQYRYGDATRLIHWRSSAKFGELQVRELETITGGEEIIICLDNSSQWQTEDFETAVIATASMYFYASKQQLEVRLWTGDEGLIRGNQVMLETLAGVTFPVTQTTEIPSLPLIWLTCNPQSLSLLPLNSRYLLFTGDETYNQQTNHRGIIYNPEIPLQTTLSQPLHNFTS